MNFLFYCCLLFVVANSFPILFPQADPNSVHSDDLSVENEVVIRRNETKHNRIERLQKFFNGVHESEWTWRDTVCGAFHKLSLFPPNCFNVKETR